MCLVKILYYQHRRLTLKIYLFNDKIILCTVIITVSSTVDNMAANNSIIIRKNFNIKRM